MKRNCHLNRKRFNEKGRRVELLQSVDFLEESSVNDSISLMMQNIFRQSVVSAH